MKHTRYIILSLAACLTLPASAVTTFTEDFDSGTSGWEGNLPITPFTHNPTGGAPGASPGFVSTSFAFSDANPFFGAVLFRGEADTNASNGAFIGNYLASNVNTIDFYVRHNAGTDIDFGLRLATAANFPGFLIPSTVPVPTGQWTLLSFDINPSNPLIQLEGPTPAASILAGIGNLQITAGIPTGFEANTTQFDFDLDAVTVNTVPEPSTSLLGLCMAVLLATRRRRS